MFSKRAKNIGRRKKIKLSVIVFIENWLSYTYYLKTFETRISYFGIREKWLVLGYGI